MDVILTTLSALTSRFRKVWDSGFESVPRAHKVNVQNGFECVCPELHDRREEVSCCTGTIHTEQPQVVHGIE